MVSLIKHWFQRYIADTEVAILWLFLLFIIAVFYCFGRMLAPVLVSIAVAYLLQWAVNVLERWRLPHAAAVAIVFSLFLGLVIISILGILPLLWHQLTTLVNELPNTVGRTQAVLMTLPDRYPSFVTADQMQELFAEFRAGFGHFGQAILSASVSSIPSIIMVVIYLVLVPMLVYFFLMDQKRILRWFNRYLPERRRLISQVWTEVYGQFGNYVSGKVLEMIIVWAVCYLAFALMGLQYAMLLGALVGVSVIIPYIGAVVVTVPVVVIAFLQWGWSPHFAYLLVIYTVILVLDGNVLVPLLFSEAMSLHPVAIIIAILIFGGLLGFWGVFFAIPLATVVKAVLNAMPAPESDSKTTKKKK